MPGTEYTTNEKILKAHRCGLQVWDSVEVLTIDSLLPTWALETPVDHTPQTSQTSPVSLPIRKSVRKWTASVNRLWETYSMSGITQCFSIKVFCLISTPPVLTAILAR